MSPILSVFGASSGLMAIILMLSPISTGAECIAHRGDSIRHPDNTLPAIESAWKQGADVVEIDIRITQDGELVLFHDADFKKKPLTEMTYEQLNAAVASYHVPSLTECLKAGEAGQRYLLDLKATSEPFLGKVLEIVQASTVSGCEVVLQSAQPEVLFYLRKNGPKEMPLFFVTNLKPNPKLPTEADKLAQKLCEAGVQGITAQGRQFVDKDYVAAFHAKGLKYYVWTINPEDQIRHYIGLGVDGVITDDPVVFRKVAPKSQPPAKQLPLPGEVFEVKGRSAFIIYPTKKIVGGTPWVWYAPTLPNLPGKSEEWMFRQWLDKGIAIVGIDVGESYGSPEGCGLYQALYDELTSKRGMAKKPCLLARSRGGLMLYNWAAEHPESVAGVAALYPVCNLTSYPGLKKACGAYGMTEDELEQKLEAHNPVSRLKPLAEAKVPLLHLHGNNDRVVPLEANSALLKTNYEKWGGVMTLEVIEGGGHDMKPHWFTSQKLVDFVSFNLVGVGDDKELRQRILDYLDEESWILEK